MFTIGQPFPPSETSSIPQFTIQFTVQLQGVTISEALAFLSKDIADSSINTMSRKLSQPVIYCAKPEFKNTSVLEQETLNNNSTLLLLVCKIEEQKFEKY